MVDDNASSGATLFWKQKKKRFFSEREGPGFLLCVVRFFFSCNIIFEKEGNTRSASGGRGGQRAPRCELKGSWKGINGRGRIKAKKVFLFSWRRAEKEREEREEEREERGKNSSSSSFLLFFQQLFLDDERK